MPRSIFFPHHNHSAISFTHPTLPHPKDIKGYPTLKVHKAGSTEGERYNGGRDLASLKAAVA